MWKNAEQKPFCWTKEAYFLSFLHSIFFCLAQNHFAEPNQHVLIFPLSNFLLMGGPHNEHQWRWRSCSSDTHHHKREVTITEVWQFRRSCNPKSRCVQKFDPCKIDFKVLWDSSGGFHFSRCQWDRITIETKLPQTLDIACKFGFLVAELLVFKVEGKLVGNNDETHLPSPASDPDPYQSLHLYQCRPR